MKPTESSEEGHGRAVEGGLQSGGLAVAPVLDPATQAPERTAEPSDGRDLGGHSDAPVRSVSGVVAAFPPSADLDGREQGGREQGGRELEEAHTTVDAGPARRFAASQAALSHRIRNALDQTLPLGTPAPDASLFAEARAQRVNYSRTMLLGGRYLAELGAAPEPPTRRAEPPQTQEVVTRRAAELPPTQRMQPGVAELTPVPAQAAAPAQAAFAQTPSPEGRASQATATQVSRQAAPSDVAPQQEGALRASFVRSVGPPTAPPPRRRRTLPPGEGPPGESTPAGGFWPEDAAEGAGPEAPALGQAARLDRSGEEPDHEAFALDRPRASAVPPPAAEASPRLLAVGATTAVSSGNTGRGSAVPFVKAPDARNPRSSILSNSVILPPPPQPHDFELPSSPPPSLAFAPTARAPSLAPATVVDAWPASGGSASRGSAGGSPRVSGAVASAARGAGVPATRGAALPTTRPPARPTAALLDLPTADPLAGYEAPRETFWQRSLIVFVVALAVVGLFALGAIAFGFLGKTGW